MMNSIISYEFNQKDKKQMQKLRLTQQSKIESKTTGKVKDKSNSKAGKNNNTFI